MSAPLLFVYLTAESTEDVERSRGTGHELKPGILSLRIAREPPVRALREWPAGTPTLQREDAGIHCRDETGRRRRNTETPIGFEP
jgi:hypothetical protein